MLPSDKEYQAHTVFSELDRYINFYRTLSEEVFRYVTLGIEARGNMDSYILSSIQGTLTSIQMILRKGMINDSYALLRKFHDSAILGIYIYLYVEEQMSIENIQSRPSYIVQQIQDWLHGKNSLPEYRVMSRCIRQNSRVAPITQILLSEESNERYEKLRGRCNDYVHYNLYHNVLYNDPNIYLPNRAQILDLFSRDLRDVVILHTAYMFFINEHYMAASEYLDCLDCGLTPDPDSQYWVAPFVQKFFDEVIVKYRPDVAEAIKELTSMHLVL